MEQKTAFFLILILLCAPFAIAAGGGGGSPSGGSSSGGSSGGTGIFFSKFKCNDAGRITFERKPQLDSIILIHSDGTKVEPTGRWDGNTFISEEAELVKQGTYALNDPLFGKKSVECPGLKFSCKLVKININSCRIIGKNLDAEFNVEGADVNELKYGFTNAAARELTYSRTGYDSALKNLKVSAAPGVNKLEVENIGNVRTLQISHPKCVGEYYVYSTIRCAQEDEKKEQEIDGKELKCGGYLDIEDRVKCRISLREGQEDEYENFYPEECKAWKDNKDKCLGFYRSVQQCWKFENGNARINCVKKQLNLGDIAAEKKGCGNDAVCTDALKEKVYALVKFRLYNLEEEAEKLYEEGILSKEQLVDFVVKMETSKLDFNKAVTKQERINVILAARRYWQELLEGMK